MMNTTPKSRDQVQKIIEDAVSRIAPNVESVVIIVTGGGPSRNGQPTSYMTKAGEGNYYAQRGSVEVWLQRQKDWDLSGQIADAMPHQPPPDDGEEWKRG